MKSRITPGPSAQFESRSFLIGLVLTGLLSVLWFVPAMRVFELKALDFLFALKGRPAPDSRVVHIDIDDSSIEKIGRWPWDRIRHAQLVDVLTEAGAGAIVFDVTFPDPQSQDNDSAFISSCAVSERVYIGFNLRVLPESAFSAQTLPWYEQAKRELLSDMALGPDELASQLGLKAREVERYATRVKEAVIEEELRRRMGEEKDFHIDAFVSLSCPGGFEERAARRVFDRLKAEHFLSESSLTPQKNRIQNEEYRIQVAGLKPQASSLLVPPLSGLARAAKGCGFVSVEPDPHDGVLRHIPLLRPHRTRMHSYLALAVLRDLEGFEIRAAAGEIVLTRQAGELRIPVNERNEVLLDWSGVADFERLPFAAVIQVADMREAALKNLCQEALTSKGLSRKLLEARAKLAQLTLQGAASPDPKAHRQAILEQRGICERERDTLLSQIERFVASAKRRGVKGEKKQEVDAYEHLAKATRKLLRRADELTQKLRSMVEGRICIIGSTHTGSTDLHPTPIGAEVPGCMAHSTLMSMFSARSFPREPWRWSSLVLLIAGGLGISLASSRLCALRSVAVTIAAILGLSLLLFVLFATTGIFLGAAGPLGAMAVAFAGTTAYRRFAEERARRRIRGIFQRQVGESVAEQLIRGAEKVELGGELRTATVYFSDIRGFSAISEKLTPPQLVDLFDYSFS